MAAPYWHAAAPRAAESSFHKAWQQPRLLLRAATRSGCALCTPDCMPRARGITRPGLRRPRRKDARPKDIGPLTSDCAAPARLTLPAQRRLRRKSDFDAAYAGGRKFGNGFFGVTAFWNDKGWPRLGLAVSVRTAGGGVQRNRIRRIIRESFRLHQHELPGVDLIVSARSRAKDAPPPELHASLERIVGTGRMKSASGTEERAHGPLVDSNQERGEVAHCSFTFCHSSSRLACSSRPAVPRARARALTTRSTGGISC